MPGQPVPVSRPVAYDHSHGKRILKAAKQIFRSHTGTNPFAKVTVSGINKREERSSRSRSSIGAEHHKTQEKTMKTTDNSQDAHEPQEKNPREPERTIPREQRENEEQWARRHGPEDVAERSEPPPFGVPDHFHNRSILPGNRIGLTIDRMDRWMSRLEEERGS